MMPSRPNLHEAPMTDAAPARLLRDLPAEARALYQRAAAAKGDAERSDLLEQLVTSVGYRTEHGPDDTRPLFPDGATLTPAQRAALRLARTLEPETGWALGPTGAALGRYVGVDPPGELERPAAGGREPLWRTLALALRTRERAALTRGVAILNRLPIARRLAACVELLDDEPYGIEGAALVEHPQLTLTRELRAEGRAWAPTAADALVAAARRPPLPRLLVFLALARAGVAIEPRWEILLPVASTGTTAGMRVFAECVAAIAPDRRVAAVVAACAASPHQVKGPAALLARYPSLELLDVLSATSDRALLLAACPKLVAAHPELTGGAAKARKPDATAPTLTCTRVTRPGAAADLSPPRARQLVECGRRYDGKRRDAATRLGPGDADSTGSFRGFVELWELADADGVVRYDAWRCMTDSGTVFRAGTTKVVATIEQFGAEADDAALVAALDAALRRPKAAGKRGPATRKQAATGTAAAKRAPRAKPSSRGAAATKSAGKKPAGKKPAATKPAGKKLEARKAARR